MKRTRAIKLGKLVWRQSLAVALMTVCLVLLAVVSAVRATSVHPDGVSAREVRFYSEGIECYGKVFTPPGFSAESKTPAVVLAPGWGETAATIEKYAQRFAARGLVAMTLDYRGWGRSGGFLQTVDQVKTDDRLRFSQMTAKVRIRRKRLAPQQQVLDIRNALYYLQGEPGVDRARVGVWGTDLAGGHVVVIAALDARIKAAVAHAPLIEGRDAPKRAFAPTGELLQAELKRVRTGQASAAKATSGAVSSTMDVETKLALAEYHPFWYVEQIPPKTAVLFVIAEKDAKVNNTTNAIAASKLLKGPTDVINIPGATHTQIDSGTAFETAANAAADWFLKHL
jgi:dienelactone hydrolase